MRTNRNFMILMLGQSSANVGDVLFTISIISIVYQYTGSAAASALVPFTVTFSMLIASILTPLLIGKIHLNVLLTGTQVGKTCLLGGLAIWLMFSNTSQQLSVIFMIVALMALQDGCANPIRQSLIPYYVADDQLIQANGTAESMTQSLQIGTWFFGSMLLMVWSPVQLLWLVFGLFSLSSFLLCRLEKVVHTEAQPDKPGKQLLKGWITIRRTPALIILTWIEFLEMLAGSVWIAAILFIFVEQALQSQAYWWGYINSAYFIGLVAGSLTCIRLSSLIMEQQHRIILIGACMTSLFTYGFGLARLPVIALILSSLIGFFEQMKNIPLQTVIQTRVPKEQLATVYTSLSSVGTATFGIATLLTGIAADYIGVRYVFLLSGGLLTAVYVLLLMNKQHIIITQAKQIND